MLTLVLRRSSDTGDCFKLCTRELYAESELLIVCSAFYKTRLVEDEDLVVERRWATMTLVFTPCIALSSALCTKSSDPVSRALVASSNKRMAGWPSAFVSALPKVAPQPALNGFWAWEPGQHRAAVLPWAPVRRYNQPQAPGSSVSR
ncbi:uncharacterized protein LOC112348535 [Selaginella moellendorffii]|uniref:uncharacterized protein LOC112348535 n=1 Tax=Selaginella moellendorffii TaxID=88036 RepID=UPI000D1CB59E|nr:uncharacterized protein LOC112348535 [Selaginella moellendorffii]|eukprot:XP_024537039.1 uncharacterized protein LOC112348535 [Selaginella moellendorffii]